MPPTDRHVDARFGDGRADARPAIQRAIDEVSAAGGGTVHLPSGVFRLSRRPGAESDSWLCLAVRTGVTLAGAGMDETTLAYDDTVHPIPAPGTTQTRHPRNVVVAVGTWLSPADHVTIRDLGVDAGNSRTAATTSGEERYQSLGVCARVDLLHPSRPDPGDWHHVTIERIRVEDAGIGIGANPRATVADGEPTDPESVPHHWVVRDCQLSRITNKAVELFAVDSLIEGTTCDDVYDGLQIIGATARRCTIRNNTVTYGETGVSISEAASDILVEGNRLTGLAEHPYPGAPGGTSSRGRNSLGGITIRREPTPGHVTFRNITIRNNRVDASATVSQRAFGFHRHDWSGPGSYEDILVEDNVFIGRVYGYDWGHPDDTDGTRITFRGNTIIGDLLTLGRWPARDLQIEDNLLTVVRTGRFAQLRALLTWWRHRLRGRVTGPATGRARSSRRR